MATAAIKNTDSSVQYVNQYIADNESDIASLPTSCSPGSTCVVITSGNVYMLNNKKQWVLFGGGSGAGGGGTGGSSTPSIWQPITG